MLFAKFLSRESCSCKYYWDFPRIAEAYTSLCAFDKQTRNQWPRFVDNINSFFKSETSASISSNTSAQYLIVQLFQ